MTAIVPIRPERTAFLLLVSPRLEPMVRSESGVSLRRAGSVPPSIVCTRYWTLSWLNSPVIWPLVRIALWMFGAE